ncbi:MAG: hypothetical protein Q7S60_04900 [bacterium]|nr:hypothetical protein [bacterium]
MERSGPTFSNQEIAQVRRLPQLPQRVLDLIHAHADASFWRPGERGVFPSSRFVVELDDQGRIKRRTRAFVRHVGAQWPTDADYYCFDYEEWDHGPDGTAIMKRQQVKGDAVVREEWLHRTYQNSVMTREVEATEYRDGERAVTVIERCPYPVTTWPVLYATIKYNGRMVNRQSFIVRDHDRVVGRPSRHIVFTQKPDGGPLRVQDYYHIHYYRTDAFVDIGDRLWDLNIPHSGSWCTADSDKKVASTVAKQNGNFTVNTGYGSLSFPAQLDFPAVFSKLRF